MGQEVLRYSYSTDRFESCEAASISSVLIIQSALVFFKIILPPCFYSCPQPLYFAHLSPEYDLLTANAYFPLPSSSGLLTAHFSTRALSNKIICRKIS